jgi:hypothetical protein
MERRPLMIGRKQKYYCKGCGQTNTRNKSLVTSSCSSCIWTLWCKDRRSADRKRQHIQAHHRPYGSAHPWRQGRHSEIAAGGILEFAMEPAPNQHRATRSADLPPSMSNSPRIAEAVRTVSVAFSCAWQEALERYKSVIAHGRKLEQTSSKA